MKAAVGDQLHVHSRTVEQSDQHAEILEVRGEDGGPPYLVRWADGHEAVVYPGGDCEVEKHAAGG